LQAQASHLQAQASHLQRCAPDLGPLSLPRHCF
jgi:hypothetical protein